MIRPCDAHDFTAIRDIINDAAQAYRGIIPDDRWTDPYMSDAKLRQELKDGVVFWGWEESGNLLGVMGLQRVEDVTLIRHAYVRTVNRRQGIGGHLLSSLRALTTDPVLIGTWAAATWAIDFYERNDFQRVAPSEKDALLTRYWVIPARQAETSVVLADATWYDRAR